MNWGFYIFKNDFKKSKYFLNSIILLDAKLLINMNHLEIYFDNVYRCKKFDKTFHTC